MVKKIAVLFLFVIIECSTFGEYIKVFFGEVVACNLETCGNDDSECESENQENKNESNKYLISFLGLNFTFKYFSAQKSIYYFRQSAERSPFQFIPLPPPKA